MYSHDVVIVGSGLAGLRAAMELVGHLDVAVMDGEVVSQLFNNATAPVTGFKLNRRSHKAPSVPFCLIHRHCGVPI
jgi:thioredoxin reductase